MAPNDEVIEPQPPAKLSWGWMICGILLAAIAIGSLWLWQHRRPPVSGACTAGDLSLTLGRTEDTTHITYVRAVVTNKGDRTCTLSGYPVVSALNSAGENRVVGDAQRNDEYKERTVIIGPGEKAYARVGFPHEDGFEPEACLTEATTLRFYVPTGAITPGMEALNTRSTRTVCPGFSVSVLRSGA